MKTHWEIIVEPSAIAVAEGIFGREVPHSGGIHHSRKKDAQAALEQYARDVAERRGLLLDEKGLPRTSGTGWMPETLRLLHTDGGVRAWVRVVKR